MKALLKENCLVKSKSNGNGLLYIHFMSAYFEPSCGADGSEIFRALRKNFKVVYGKQA